MPRKPTKTTKKTVKTAAPVAARAPEMHECQCGCHHGKFKKFIVLLIVFLLGFAVAKFTCCHRKHFMPMGPKMHPVFQNGCLDMASVKCPKMVDMLQASEANVDGCITKEEFRAMKKAMRHDMPHHPMAPAPEAPAPVVDAE